MPLWRARRVRATEQPSSGGRRWIEAGEPITLAGATLLRFDGEGNVVDHRDYWNHAPGRIDPYPGW